MINIEIKRYSRNIGLIAGILLLLSLFSYRSFETKYVFYISWISGLALIGMFLLLFIFRLKIDRAAVKSLAVILPWFILGGILTLFAFDKLEHIKVLVISTFYMVSSVCFSALLLKSRISLKKYSFIMLILWTGINAILLCLFYLEFYTPTKLDFSGVFHDRNVFSITTLLVMAFSYSFFSNHQKTNSSRYVFYLCMTICCLFIIISKSLTGLLGLFLLATLFSFKLSLFKRLVIFIFLLAFSCVTLLTDNPINDRVERFVLVATGDTDLLRQNESAYLRAYLIKSGIKLAMEHPIVGVGINNAKNFVIWPLRDTGSFLHNTYLDILTSGGVPLFIVYYTPIFFSLLWLMKNRKRVRSKLDSNSYSLWVSGFTFLSLKLMYDITWTSYFEFFMVFTVMFSIYIVFHLKSSLKKVHYITRPVC